jgi:3-oxoacyl-[acyl-carrier-protein] synthase-3
MLKMCTRIKATAISPETNVYSAIEHAASAGEKCIENAGISEYDIGLLINIGIYRDNNICEPAIAALIQQKMGINPDPLVYQVQNTMFSFDLTNTECGILNAIQVADVSMKADHIKYALIVSCDTHPSQKIVEGFPFAPLGAAMLLEISGNEEKGFQGFSFKSSIGKPFGYEGYFDTEKDGTNSRHHVTISFDYDFIAHLQEFAAQTAVEFIKFNQLKPSDLYLISPSIEHEFGKRIANQIGITEEKVIDCFDQYGNTHTSAMTLNFHEGTKKKLYKEGDQLLFLAVGAGPTAACGFYIV